MSENITENTVQEIPENIPENDLLEALRRLHILNTNEIFIHRIYTTKSLIEFLLDDGKLTNYPGITHSVLTELFEPDTPTIFSSLEILLDDLISDLSERYDEENIEFRQLIRNIAEMCGLPGAQNRYEGLPEFTTVQSLLAAISRLEPTSLNHATI